jgi:CBS domain-containing protein
MLVKEVMNKKVIVVEPEAFLKEAIAIMNDNNIGSVVVVKNNKIVGILTEGDVLRMLVKNKIMDINQLKVEDTMTRWVITIGPDDTIKKAIELMMKYHIKKLPVVKNEKLVGIITASDIATVQPKLIEKLLGS